MGGAVLPLQKSLLSSIFVLRIITFNTMPTKRVSDIFKELTYDKKLLGIGSLILIASVFLPWYQDMDSFNTGDMFLGVTGPLYLVGFTLLAIGVLNLFLLVSEFSGKKVSYMPFKSSSIYLASGLFIFYALMVVSSVYFHQKFGINITVKQSQFGMFTTFIAASLITIGGYLIGRDKKTLLKEFQDEAKGKVTAEPFIKMPEQEKPKENIRPEPVINQPQPQRQAVPAPQPKPPSTPEQATESNNVDKDQTPPQTFRMDL